MLAEPKRKTVWSLNPRGKYWSEDKSKIGQKLLESMGWREGLGLGKNNTGIKDNIKLNINLDNKGLGFKVSNDVWVDKNDDFEQLLANLAVHHNNGSNRSEPKVSDLEETSKKLKNRLHYSKFIKSKNLSQCSEKDLISIFPKKRRNCESKGITETSEELSAQEVNDSDNTFESTTNITDYFKSKMDKLKLKFNEIYSPKAEEKVKHEIIERVKEEVKQEVIQEVKEKIKEQETKEENTTKSVKRKSKVLTEGSDDSIIDSNHKKHKKSKKKSKRNKEEKSCFDNYSNEDIECQSIQQNVIKNVKSNKKHKSKRVSDSEQRPETECQSPNDKSRKSNKKIKLNPETYATAVPKGYDSNSISVAESLKNYHKICSAIGKDRALSTTNLITLKGYGCHSR